MTQIVSSIEFAKWILEQPDERAVDMSETTGRSPCGCLMVQYAREVLECNNSDIMCGAIGFTSPVSDQSFRLDGSIGELVPTTWWHLHTFRDCKPHVRRFLEAKGV